MWHDHAAKGSAGPPWWHFLGLRQMGGYLQSSSGGGSSCFGWVCSRQLRLCSLAAEKGRKAPTGTSRNARPGAPPGRGRPAPGATPFAGTGRRADRPPHQGRPAVRRDHGPAGPGPRGEPGLQGPAGAAGPRGVKGERGGPERPAPPAGRLCVQRLRRRLRLRQDRDRGLLRRQHSADLDVKPHNRMRRSRQAGSAHDP